jgi:Zn ribbon nucleic-acid-binding protein
MDSPVRRIQLPDPNDPKSVAPGKPPAWTQLASWLIGPAFFAVVIGAVLLIRNGPEQLFNVVIAGVFLLPLTWGVISLLSPAHPDRRCPECNELALEMVAEDALYGLSCTACGHVDDTATAWKFLEERGNPLEPLVIKSRKNR